ncbi:MAG: tetratricopeptide repeat protein [Verrucomicrobia bacterium]|nr:tetratricopeptide repeat protein [Verrucomicrobiota bacterium]
MDVWRWPAAARTAALLVALAGAISGTGCRTTGAHPAGAGGSTAAMAPAGEPEADVERRIQAHAAFAAGVLYQERDEPEAAFRQFARASEKDPGNEPLATEVAGHYLQRGQLEDAVRVLRRTAALPETSGVTHALLAITLRRSGKTNEAITSYRDAIRATPTLLAAHQELAELYLALGQPAQARAAVGESLKASSDSPVHWLNTADLFAWLAQADGGSKAEAEAGRRIALDRAAVLKPEDPGQLLRLGRARMELGDAEAAEALIQQAGRQLPKDPAIAASMAELLIREGRLKEARDSLELLSRFNPTSHFPWYFLGIIDLEEDRAEDAIRKFQQAILLNPDFEPAYSDLAVAQLNRKEVSEALATLARARPRFPESHRLILLTGAVQSRAPDPAEALATFEEAERVARKTAPDAVDHRFYFQAGAALERGGHIPESVRYLEKSLEAKPDFDEALNHLGYLWAERGEHLDRALEMIQRAVDAEPGNPAYLDSLGWVYFKLGKPAEALPWMEKAARFLPEPDATVLDHLGDVLNALGRTQEARDAWQKSLKVEASAEIRKKLGLPAE